MIHGVTGLVSWAGKPLALSDFHPKRQWNSRQSHHEGHPSHTTGWHVAGQSRQYIFDMIPLGGLSVSRRRGWWGES